MTVQLRAGRGICSDEAFQGQQSEELASMTFLRALKGSAIIVALFMICSEKSAGLCWLLTHFRSRLGKQFKCGNSAREGLVSQRFYLKSLHSGFNGTRRKILGRSKDRLELKSQAVENHEFHHNLPVAFINEPRSEF